MVPVSILGARRILCLGAHSDDIEIGCGGTILSLIKGDPSIEFYWSVFSGDAQRAKEAKNSAKSFLQGAKKKRVSTEGFKVSYFPAQWSAVKKRLELIRKQFEPDLVFTHTRNDRHQDHRVLNELAWNTFRNHLVLEYEILKYDGDLGTPNVFMPLSAEICAQKTDLLMKHFKTQNNKHWFTPDSFAALHRIRGVECASPSGFAEAFYGRKVVLSASI